MSTLEELMELDMINKCAYEGTKQSRWKETTQRYISNLLINTSVKSAMSICYFLTLNYRKCATHVIYDNYASIKNRGTSFARKRFEVMLRRYVRENGIDGYILFIDIKKYFENIDHDVLKSLIYPHIMNENKDVIDLIYYIIDTSSKTDKGLNLGSEAPQILALYYLTPVDIFIKVVKGIKHYGRYMDDAFIILKSKKELSLLLKEIEKVLSTLKLEINKKKTHIVKLSHGFTFLQIKYNVLKSGRILKRLTRKKIVRERRRLKAFKRMYDLGIMTENDIWNCYQSWRGTIIKEHNACYHSIHAMDRLYKSLFPTHKEIKKVGRKEICNEIFEAANTNDLNKIFI